MEINNQTPGMESLHEQIYIFLTYLYGAILLFLFFLLLLLIFPISKVYLVFANLKQPHWIASRQNFFEKISIHVTVSQTVGGLQDIDGVLQHLDMKLG